jgi:hypothetical protein
MPPTPERPEYYSQYIIVRGVRGEVQVAEIGRAHSTVAAGGCVHDP